MDQSGWDEKMGRKYTAIYAGARKNDFSTHQPLSDDARANLQGEVDRLYEMFVASVARNRGIPPALVRKTDAGLYWGEKAISAGLADQIGSFDDALAAVTQASRASRQARATASAEAQIEERKENEPMAQPIETKPADAPAPAAAPVETKPAAEAPAPAAPAAAPPAPPLRNPLLLRLLLPSWMPPQSRRAIRAEHEEVAALCTLAGEPGFLAEAISKRMTAAAGSRGVARAQGSEVAGHADPFAGGWLSGRRGVAVERRRHQPRGAASTSRSRRRIRKC